MSVLLDRVKRKPLEALVWSVCVSLLVAGAIAIATGCSVRALVVSTCVLSSVAWIVSRKIEQIREAERWHASFVKFEGAEIRIGDGVMLDPIAVQGLAANSRRRLASLGLDTRRDPKIEVLSRVEFAGRPVHGLIENGIISIEWRDVDSLAALVTHELAHYYLQLAGWASESRKDVEAQHEWIKEKGVL